MNLNVNGKDYTIDAEDNTTLLDALRIHLNLTGTKYGCGEAVCGACKVLIDGRAVPSCITPVANVQHKSIITIEGLSKNGALHPIQQAFLDADAFQCGYCTSGMIITAVALQQQKPHATHKEIIAAMQGNICRCCTYPRIVQAISKA